MKKIIALLLSIAMVSCMLSGCIKGHFSFDSDGMTRGQWVESLAAVFGLEEYEAEEPYLSDVVFSDPIFAPVQSCYEWGILRDVSKKLKKDSSATLKFVITTAVYAAGVDFSSYEGKTDADKALKYAVDNGIAPSGLNYKKAASSEQCQAVLAAVQNAYLSQEIEPIEKVVINEAVLDCRDSDNIEPIAENTYVVTGIQPSVGEVFIAPGTKENPNGVAIKVTEVVDNGDGTYSVETTTPEVYEVFDEIEYAGVVVPQFEDIIPSEGVTIKKLDNGTTGSAEPLSYVSNAEPRLGARPLSTEEGGAGVAMLAYDEQHNLIEVPMDIGTSKESALSFTAEFDFTDGKVSLNSEWNDFSIGMELGENAKVSVNKKWDNFSVGIEMGEDSEDPEEVLDAEALKNFRETNTKYFAEENEIIENFKNNRISEDEFIEQMHEKGHIVPFVESGKEKYNAGLEVKGSIGIEDLYIIPCYTLKTQKIFGVDTGIPVGISNFSLEVNYKATVSASLVGKFGGELSLCRVPVALGGIAVLDLELLLYLNASGELEIKAVVENNTKFEYIEGNTKKTSRQSEPMVSVESKVVVELGPKFQGKLSVLAIPLIDASVSAAIELEQSSKLEYATEFTETDEAFIIDRKMAFIQSDKCNVPIVRIGIGIDKKSLANKIGITFSWTVVGTEKSGAPIRAFELWNVEDKETFDLEHLELTKEGRVESGEDDGIGSNMSISTYYIHMEKGDTTAIDLKYPSGYKEEDFEWISSDSSIVSVADGELKAKESGSVLITAKSKDGQYYACCAVYVGIAQQEAGSNGGGVGSYSGGGGGKSSGGGGGGSFGGGGGGSR